MRASTSVAAVWAIIFFPFFRDHRPKSPEKTESLSRLHNTTVLRKVTFRYNITKNFGLICHV